MEKHAWIDAVFWPLIAITKIRAHGIRVRSSESSAKATWLSRSIKSTKLWAGALVEGLWEEARVPKVMSSSPSIISWMDIFSHLFIVRIVMFV